MIFGTDGTSELGRLQAFQQSVENTKQVGDPSKMVYIHSWKDALEKFPFLAFEDNSSRGGSEKNDFQAIFNGNAGWVDSTKAMQVIKGRCDDLGVQFMAGDQGTVVKTIWDEARNNVIGVETQDGCQHLAHKVISAAGSYSDTLMDFKGQLESVCSVTYSTSRFIS